MADGPAEPAEAGEDEPDPMAAAMRERALAGDGAASIA